MALRSNIEHGVAVFADTTLHEPYPTGREDCERMLAALRTLEPERADVFDKALSGEWDEWDRRHLMVWWLWAFATRAARPHDADSADLPAGMWQSYDGVLNMAAGDEPLSEVVPQAARKAAEFGYPVVRVWYRTDLEDGPHGWLLAVAG